MGAGLGFSTNDLLLAIMVELRAMNNMLSEEFGQEDQLEEWRNDGRATLGQPDGNILISED